MLPAGVVGVVGAGTMGSGIAQLFALHDYKVVIADKSADALVAALPRIREHTAPELWDKVSGNIRTDSDPAALAECGLVIEAVFEDFEVKKEVLHSIGHICKKNAIIATNTSSISIDDLAIFLPDPSRFIGMHFMNPPKVMQLVEVIKGSRTSAETVDRVVDIAHGLGKVTAIVKDTPGFITNRLLFAFLGEAMRFYEEGAASKEDIDKAMKYGMSHPMGPLELSDFIGLDVCREIMLYIFGKLDDQKYQPPAILERLVRAGKLGKKSGEGFYKY